MITEQYQIFNHLLATKAQRFWNFVLDSIFVYILILSAGTTVVLIGDNFNNLALSKWVEHLTPAEIIFYSILIAFLYYFLTEVYFSRTLAKMLTKTIVVKFDGSKPTITAIFYRTASRLIPIDFISYMGAVPSGWHDALSRTYVVNRRDFIKDRTAFKKRKDRYILF